MSEELNLLLSTPVSQEKVFFSKFLETTTDSSWMVLSFVLPVFIAYGTVYHSPFYFYLGIPFILLPFLMIPSGIGISITILISRVLPARMARNFFFLLSIFAFIILYLLFRFLRPERFANPEAFSSLVGYFTELAIPASPWLPSYWATKATLPLLKGSWEDLLFISLWSWVQPWFPSLSLDGLLKGSTMTDGQRPRQKKYNLQMDGYREILFDHKKPSEEIPYITDCP